MSAHLLPRNFVEKPWGRADIPALFGAAQRRIGEIWFDTPGTPLPVLVKWLFTSEKLSIQVHPSNAEALERNLPSGKEECWIVTHAEPGATLGIGLTRELTAQELREASLSGAIEQLMDWKPVKAGDWFFIPAGTVHAIGAGVTLVEVQQNADITYRLFDYGRPRELHLDDGIAVSRPEPYTGPNSSLNRISPATPFVVGPNFSITRLVGGFEDDGFDERRRLLIPLLGRVLTSAGSTAVGNTVLLDPHTSFMLEPDAECLMATIDV